jgi:squalene/oxidosqualene cyclase-like protein
VGLTTLNYFALKLSGYHQEDPSLASARDFILLCGGAESIHDVYKLLLAIFDQYQFPSLPHVPLLPLLWVSHEFSWLRMMLIPYVVVLNERAFVQPPEEAYITELFLDRANGRFIPEDAAILSAMDSVAVASQKEFEQDGLPFHSSCYDSYRIYVDWLLARQNTSDGLFYDYMPTTLFPLLSLKAIENVVDSQQAIDKALEGLRLLQHDLPEGIYQPPSDSTIMDTATMVAALTMADLSLESPIVQKGVDFLWSHQHEKPGEWLHQLATPVSPGGWGFNLNSEIYPDADDTAMTLRALRDVYGDSWHERESDFRRGIDWLVAMQNWDGGWGTWDRQGGLLSILLNIIMKRVASPLVLSESVVDHTTRVLITLGRFGYTEASSPSVRRGAAWVKAQRLEDGSWEGTWGVDYLYQTAFVLGGLSKVKAAMTDDSVEASLGYILEKQMEDGGWGESPLSFWYGHYIPLGYSSPSQTAMILFGLIHFLQGRDYQDIDHLRDPINNAVNCLLATQAGDGLWRDPAFVSVVFPRLQYARYPIFQESVILWALAMYRQDMDHFRESSGDDPVDTEPDDPSGCYIATAALGTDMTRKTEVLREFRDAYLVTNRPGRSFVEAYYKYSPPVADYISGRGWLKAAVRALLLPVIGLVSLFV